MVTFAATLLTGDPVLLMLPEGASLDERAEMRAHLALDRPLPVQYWLYVSRAVQGDFGVSLRHRQPALKLVLERMPATLELTAAALVFSVALAVPIGVLSATRRNTWPDHLAMLGVLLGQSIPNFWLGIVIILVFGVSLQWLPISGRGTWLQLVGPAVTLGCFPLARNVRLIRSSLLEVLGEGYIRTARAKGLDERRVVYRHGLGSALIPVVTIVGLQFGFFLGGAVVTETVFAWPGVGRLIVQAIYGRDFPVIQAGVVLLSLGFVTINLAVDLLYGYLDPRIRLHAAA
jgi:ABC-type dipeptide/oligopeptide/nickel transport system permease component